MLQELFLYLLRRDPRADWDCDLLSTFVGTSSRGPPLSGVSFSVSGWVERVLICDGGGRNPTCHLKHDFILASYLTYILLLRPCAPIATRVKRTVREKKCAFSV